MRTDSEPLDEEPQLKRLNWKTSALVATIPFFVFVCVLEAFSPQSLGLDGISLKTGASTTALSSAQFNAAMSLELLNYSVYVFIQAMVCLFAALYFLLLLNDSSKRNSVLIFCAASSSFLIGLLVWIVLEATAFRSVMIEPLIDSISYLGAEKLPLGVWLSSWSLPLLLVGPTAVGIFAVFLASASFHLRLFHTLEHDDRLAHLIHRVLKTDLMVLSLVLISSTLCARAFLHLIVPLLPPSGQGAVFNSVAQTASVASGILFSATMIAAFLPGVAVTLFGGDEVSTGEGEESLISRIAKDWNLSTKKLGGIIQAILAVLAPALVAPVAEILQALS